MPSLSLRLFATLILIPAVIAVSDYPFLGVPSGGVRSPCPGLNALANHGILPNTGLEVTAKILVQGLTYFGLEAHSSGLMAAEFIERFGSANSSGIMSFNLDALNVHSAGLAQYTAVEHDASLTREDAYFGDAVTISARKVNRLLSNANGNGAIDISGLASAIQRERLYSYLYNPTFTDNFDLSAQLFSFHSASFILLIFGGNQSLSNIASARCSVDFATSFLMNERIPDTWIQPDPPITTGQMAAVAVQIYDQIETTIPDIFYVQFFLVYLAIILGPAILILHYSATKTEKLLGIRFQKSKKLALYVIYVIPEFISFVLLAVCLLPQVSYSAITGSHFIQLSTSDYNVFMSAGTFFVVAYIAELVFHGDEMRRMLILHHGATIITILTGFLVAVISSDILLNQFVIVSGSSILLHASLDFIPHFFLWMRIVKAPYFITRVFGWLSIWPLTIMRILANVLYVAIAVHYARKILQDVNSYFIGWAIFLSLAVAVVALTQFWAHRIYVSVQSKDAKAFANTIASSHAVLSQTLAVSVTSFSGMSEENESQSNMRLPSTINSAEFLLSTKKSCDQISPRSSYIPSPLSSQ